MSSKQQGDLGVAAAINHYMNLGYVVSFPLTDTARYDLVVDRGGLLRLEVKTTMRTRPSGSYEASLCTKGGNQSWTGVIKTLSSDECDLVFVWTPIGAYEFPIEVVEGMKTITLGSKYDEYKLGSDVDTASYT